MVNKKYDFLQNLEAVAYEWSRISRKDIVSHKKKFIESFIGTIEKEIIAFQEFVSKNTDGCDQTGDELLTADILQPEYLEEIQ